MPHIHTDPQQHDITISAWIIRREQNKWKCLVHFHKKMDVLMQVGGHIELDETPWQAVAHELEEESGYTLGELQVLQPFADYPVADHAIIHPVPAIVNTHNVGGEHYHSDLGYAFMAESVPRREVGAGESADLRWLSLDELRSGVGNGEVLKDVVVAYEFIVRHASEFATLPAGDFSINKPAAPIATYKRGAVERAN